MNEQQALDLLKQLIDRAVQKGILLSSDEVLLQINALEILRKKCILEIPSINNQTNN